LAISVAAGASADVGVVDVGVVDGVGVDSGAGPQLIRVKSKAQLHSKVLMFIGCLIEFLLWTVLSKWLFQSKLSASFHNLPNNT
jgi:hypothetical protein